MATATTAAATTQRGATAQAAAQREATAQAAAQQAAAVPATASAPAGTGGTAGAGTTQGHQQHPLTMYLWVWVLLFVLSAFSYMVDYAGLEGYLRWSLIVVFMLAKAGLIVAVFMHMAWERIALIYAILGPPVLLLVIIACMAVEGDYTRLTRLEFFGATDFMPSHPAETP